MATRDDIYTAIRNADAAGDSESVRKLGVYLATMPDDVPTAPVAEETAPQVKHDHSGVNALILGARKGVENIGKAAAVAMPGVINAVDDVGAKFGMPSTMEVATANDAARAGNDRTGWQTVGNIIGTAPTLALPGGAAVQGAAQGALLTDAKTPEGVGLDTLAGGAFGKVGELAMQGTARLIGPKIGKYTAQLKDSGILATPGQFARGAKTKLGNIAAGIEDKLTSYPIIGDMIQGDRAAANDQFNRAVTNRVLKPLGKALPDAIETGHDAIKYAKDAVTGAYQAVLPKLSGTFDDTFGTRVQAIIKRADFRPEQQAAIADIVQRDLGKMFDNAGNYSGKALGKVVDKLDKMAAGFKASQDTYTRDLGEAVGGIREQVLALARRNSPEAARDLKAAARAHAEMVRVERGAANTVEGIMTPGQFDTAVHQSDRTMRRGGSSRGDAMAQDFSKAARSTLPSKVGDSGTFTRAATSNPISWTVGALAAPAYLAAKGARNLATRNASPKMQRLGDLVSKNARIGALAVPPLLASRND
jgi:hypothetical protein